MEGKITVVTGTPRSGTSLTMRKLKFLGLKVAGKKWLKPEKLDSLKEKNEGGFYEIPGVVMRGFSSEEEIDKNDAWGKVVKIMSPGLQNMYHNGMIKYVDKVIFCLRDPRAVSVSQANLDKNVSIASDGGWAQPEMTPDPVRYLSEISIMANYILRNKNLKNVLVIDYDYHIKNPEEIKQNIMNFFSIQDRTGIELVKTKLNRSKMIDWHKRFYQFGIIADRLYDSIKNLNYKEIDDTLMTISLALYEEELEQTMWYDDKYCSILNSYMLRTRDKEKMKEAARVSILKGIDFRASSYYKDIPGETYTIKRPQDIGDLTRNMVFYDGKFMTYEAANTLHRHRFTRENPEIKDFNERLKLVKELEL